MIQLGTLISCIVYPKNQKRHEEIQFGKKFYNHISESQKIILVPNTQVLSLDGNNKVENIYYASDNKIKSIRPNITILATGGMKILEFCYTPRKYLKTIFKRSNYWKKVDGTHNRISHWIFCR